MRIRIFGQYIHSHVVALAGVEFVLFLMAFLAAVQVRTGGEVYLINGEEVRLLPRAALFAAATTLSFFALGLYTARQRARMIGVGLRIALGVLATVLLLAMVFYLLPDLDIGRGVAALAAAFAAVSSFLTRALVGRLVDGELMKKRVLIYGTPERLQAFGRLRRRSDRRGFQLIGVVAPNGCASPGTSIAEIPVLDGTRCLRDLCEELAVDEIVVALSDRRGVLPHKDLLDCRLAGITVVDLSTFLERETGRIQLDVLNPSWLIFNDGFSRSGLRLFTSRLLDFVASALLLVFAMPIMLLAALAIWLEDGRKGGGIFYRQERVGFEGRTFQLLKFRSMRVDAEAPGRPQWARKNDSRVTRVGGFIRKCRIDELPQLLNVLQGHMSFVGPRPERPHFVQELQERIPFYAYRHTVKPGITGWAQLCYPYGASEQDAAEKLQYDLYYIKNNSLIFDIGILVQTAEVVFLGKGAR